MQTDVHTKKEKRQCVKLGKPFDYESRLKIKNLGAVGEGCVRESSYWSIIGFNGIMHVVDWLQKNTKECCLLSAAHNIYPAKNTTV